MASHFYEPGARRTLKVRDLFATIAPRYDRINDLQSFGLHRTWKRRLVRLAEVKAGTPALDVCCGTGDIAFALARRGARVIGLDFSDAMLGIARKRAVAAQPAPPFPDGTAISPAAPSPLFIQADAQRLPFPDACFEVVTIGYGLRNLDSWEAGLQEMHRVARPGGRLLVLDFGKPANALWRAVYFGYLKFFIPLLGKAVCGDAAAYAYILESLKHYPAQQGVAAGMHALSLARVRTINLLGGVMSINLGEKQ